MKQALMVLSLWIGLVGRMDSVHAGTVLFIGDSHSTAPFAPFGARFNELLRTLPNSKVYFYSRCGSILDWFYTGQGGKCGFFDQEASGPSQSGLEKTAPNVIERINTLKPDLMIVELGANYMLANDPARLVKKDISRFITEIQNRGIPCIWVGQPQRRIPADPIQASTIRSQMQTTIQAVRETVEPVCTYVDSTQLTVFPATGGRDGVHYSFPEGIPVGRKWAESVFESLVLKFYKE